MKTIRGTISALFVLIVLGGLFLLGNYIYAAVITPTSEHVIDGWGQEPYKLKATMRSSLILTNSYVNTDTIDTKGFANCTLLFKLTKGSLTSFEYKILESDDNANWFQEATETITASIITDTPVYYTQALGGNELWFKVISCDARWLKLQVKGTGTVTGSLCEIDIVGVK